MLIPLLMMSNGLRVTSREYSSATSYMCENNPNKSGIYSKEAWKNADDSRRERQAEIMREINRKKKEKYENSLEVVGMTCINCDAEFEIKRKIGSDTTKRFCSRSCASKYTTNKLFSDETLDIRKKISESQKLGYQNGRINPFKGKQNPKSAENGRNGAKKQSERCTGRKVVYRDGKRTYAYPGDEDYPTTSVAKQVGTVSDAIATQP